MNKFLKSRRLYILFVLPFMVTAILFFGIWFADFQPFIEAVQEDAFIAFPLPATWWGSMLLAGFLLSCMAYLVFFFTNRYKLLDQQTTLPAFLFVLLGSVIALHLSNIAWLLSAFLIVMALARLQTAINHLYVNAPLFDFGALLMFAVIVSPQLSFLLLWAIGVLIFSGRSTLRDFAALLVGLLFPLGCLAFWGYWTDTLGTYPERYLRLLWGGEWVEALPVSEWIRLAVLAVLFLFAVLHIFSRYAVLIVNQRRGLFSFISLSLFLLFIPILFPVGYDDILFLFALPLSVLYAYYFITNRLLWLGNVFFFLLLLACAVEYIMP